MPEALAATARRHLPLLLALCLVAPLYLAWTWSGQLGAIDSDGPTYLMMAQHYARGAADHSVGAIASSYVRFPPLYPQLLHWLGGADDLARAHRVTCAFLLLGLAAYYAWLRLEGLAGWPAAGLLLALAAAPQSWLLGLLIQSEYLYLAASLLALAALAGFARSGRPETLYLAGLAVAAAWLSRSVGLVLLLPLLAAAWRAPRRTALLALLIAAAPGLLWSLAHGQGSGYSGSLLLSYGEHPLAGLREQLARELPALRRAFEQDLSYSAWAAPLLDLLGLLGLAAALGRAWRLKADGLYALTYLALLALWPYPDEARRLLWPLLPVLLAQPVLLALDRRWNPGRMAAALAAVLIACSVPALALAGERVSESAALGRPELRGLLYWYEADPARARRWAEMEIAITAALRRINTEIPQDDCVLSTRPELVNQLAHRHSIYPPPDTAPDEVFWQRLAATGCRYVFMTRRTYAGYPQPMYPLERFGETLELVDRCPLPQGHLDDASRACALGRIGAPPG